MRCLALALLLLPTAARAHDAFGDLGPFYAAFLHPLADPAQGLILVATGVLLARQPLATVRPAYAALALAGGLGVLLGAAAALASPGLALTALAATALGLGALPGIAFPRGLVVALAVAAAAWAGLAVDLPPGVRSGGLAALGGALGIALAVLFAWGLVDTLHRLGRVAGAVAGSWVAAVGLMAAAFALTGRA